MSNIYHPAFPLNLSGKKILLLDDVFDSGATLDQVSSILRQAGADRICVLVLTKTQGFLRTRPTNI